jgi:photoactive yellow protein
MALDTTTRMLSPYLDRLSDEELDAIPYGVIQIDAEGRVLSYNAVEAADTGYSEARPIGRDYFSDVAPSSFVAEIFGRYVEGFSSHHLDEVFRFTFTHAMMPRTVLMRMYYSPRTGSIWMFTANPDGSPIGPAAGRREAMTERRSAQVA